MKGDYGRNAMVLFYLRESVYQELPINKKPRYCKQYRGLLEASERRDSNPRP